MRSNHKRKGNKRRYLLIGVSILLLVFLSLFFLKKEKYFLKDDSPDINEEEPKTDEVENTKDNIEKMTFIAAGDLMFHDDQLKSAYDSESDQYDFNEYFEYVKPYFENADLAIANLETTLAGDRLPYVGYPFFNSPDSVIDAIKKSGIDLVTTTNNHSFDTDLEGLQRTAKTLENHDLDYVGTYYSSPTSRIKMKQINNIDIGILAYTEMINDQNNLNMSNEELKEHINLMDKDSITQDVQEAKDNDADIIIASMHWGVEYDHEPSATQKEYAQFLADEGVDIIIGSHPHVIQPSEELESNNTFVIYSLGNFISNQRRETLGDDLSRTEDGLIVQIEIEKNLEEDNTEITAINYIPTWVYKSEEKNGKYEYKIIPTEDFINNKNNIADNNTEIPLDRIQESLDATKKILQIE